MSWPLMPSSNDLYMLSRFMDCEPDDQPETAVCPQCGDTAYLDDDGSYVCPECGNDFEDNED